MAQLSTRATAVRSSLRVTRWTPRAAVLIRLAPMWAPSACSRHTDSGVSSRRRAEGAASRAGSSAVNSPEHAGPGAAPERECVRVEPRPVKAARTGLRRARLRRARHGDDSSGRGGAALLRCHPWEGSSEMARPRHDHLWALAHAERAALARDLAGLTAEQWRHGTLCGEWDVEHVVAHLTAAASLNQWQWLRSMLAARFRPDVHNQRRLEEHRGSTPAATP